MFRIYNLRFQSFFHGGWNRCPLCRSASNAFFFKFEFVICCIDSYLGGIMQLHDIQGTSMSCVIVPCAIKCTLCCICLARCCLGLETRVIIKRASLLGNEETHLVGDSTVFEIEYPNLEQKSIFAKKSNHLYVRMVEWMGRNFDVFPGFQEISWYA